MKIQKKEIIYTNTELEIEGATLLSVDEADALPLRLRKYENSWWLRTPGFNSYITAGVNMYGSVGIYGYSVNYRSIAVRPALQISNLKSSNLKIRDVFKFGGKEFEIISNTLAFCKTDIGNHRFDNDYNDYKKSKIKKYVDAWFEKNKE